MATFQYTIRNLFDSLQFNDAQTTKAILDQLSQNSSSDDNTFNINNICDDERFASPLHWACYHGNIDTIRLLLSYGASLKTYVKNRNVSSNNEQDIDSEYQTPLMWCVQGGSLPCLQFLIQHYMHSQHEMDESNMVRTLFKEHVQKRTGYNLLMLAIQDDHISIVQYLMYHLYSNENGNVELTTESIQDMYTKYLDNESHTILHWACYEGYEHQVKFIIQFFKYHSKERIEMLDFYQHLYNFIVAKDTFNRTAFHWIARKGYLNIMRYLLMEFLIAEKILGLTSLKEVISERDTVGNSVLDYVGYSDFLQGILNPLLELYKNNEHINDHLISKLKEQSLIERGFSNEELLTKKSIEILESQPVTISDMMKVKTLHYRFLIPIVVYPLFMIMLNIMPIYLAILIIPLVFYLHTKTKNYVIRVSGSKHHGNIRDLLFFGLFPSSILFGLMVLFYNILPIYYSSLFLILFIPSVSICAYLWYQLTVNCDPGYYKDIQKENCVSVSSIDESFFKHRGWEIEGNYSHIYSSELLIRKPIRSKFDRVTDQIVIRFDHYCVYTLNPIGEKNHVKFLAFVYSVAISSFLFVNIAACSLYILVNDSDSSMLYVVLMENPCITIATAYFIVFSLFGSILSIQQTIAVMFNNTAFEMMKPDRHFYIVNSSNYSEYISKHYNGIVHYFIDIINPRTKYLNLFDKGIVENCKEFLFTNRPYYGSIFNLTTNPFVESFLTTHHIRVPFSINQPVGQ